MGQSCGELQEAGAMQFKQKATKRNEEQPANSEMETVRRTFVHDVVTVTTAVLEFRPQR